MSDTQNPFEFERDPKRFLQILEQERNEKKEVDEEIKKITRTQQLYMSSDKANRYGLLAKLEDQTNKLKQERDEMFAREAKSKNPNKQQDLVAQHLKHFNPKLMEQKEVEVQKKNYRIRAILREKRETLIEFIQKKREICLANLNIIKKKEETNTLEDYIKNEQESLRARKLYFKNDCELVKKFMNQVKAEADQATQLADKEAKKKDEVKSEVAKILATTDRLKILKTKFQEEYERLDKYRQFLEKLQDNHKSKFAEFEKLQTQSVLNDLQDGQINPFFVTGVDVTQLDPRKMTPEQQKALEMQDRMANAVIEILNNIEEGNLRNIQNQRDSEEEIEQKKRELEGLQENLKKNQEDNLERLRVLEKQYLTQKQYQHQLRKQETVDQTKLQFAEGEDLDMEKIGKKIIEIWAELIKKDLDLVKKMSLDSKSIKTVMNSLEKNVIELSQMKIIFCEKYKNEFIDAEKKIKQQKKEQRQNNQKDEEKKKQIIERRQKKEEYLKHFYKGRHDMKRNYIQEKTPPKTDEPIDTNNDDEKYFTEEYELVYVPQAQSKKVKNPEQVSSNNINIDQLQQQSKQND